jgi:quinol monooxygenase YgiN
MVQVIFTFQVSGDKQEEFIKFIKSGTKPGRESHACLAYNVRQAARENACVKTMEFPDLATMGKVMPANEQNPTCKALIENFESYVTNISRKSYIKMT